MRPLHQCLRLLHSPSPPVLSTAAAAPTVRCLATVSPRRPQTTFSDALNAGPSLSDFLSGPPDDPLSIPGTSHLPSWLKRPIPAGGNFAKIKKDLRGLNLHTGRNTPPQTAFRREG